MKCRPKPAVSRILLPCSVTQTGLTIIHLGRRLPGTPLATYPEAQTGRPICFPIWSCTRWGLPSFSSHLENWCALTAPFHPYQTLAKAKYLAVCFLLHLPARHRDSPLESTLPCGVRTFLQPQPAVSDRLVDFDRSLIVTGYYQKGQTSSQ